MSETLPRPDQKLCTGCERRPAVANGLCTLCYHEMLDSSDAQRSERGADEDARISAAFDKAITQAPYCFAAPDRDHGKPTGRTLLLHPACYAQVVEFYEDAKPSTRHHAEPLVDGRMVCDACNGDLDRRARELRTLGEVLEPEEEFARPMGAA